MLGFTAAMAVGTCLLFGLLPALRATRIAPAAAMRAGGRGTTAGRERYGLRRALVTAQVALSLVLLVGALLFVRSLQKLLDVQPGFRPEGIVAVNIDISPAKYPKERRLEVYRDLLGRLRGQAGVVSAAEVGMTPISGSGWNESVRPDAFTGEPKNSYFNRYGPGYLKTMGTPLLAGRDFDARDTVGAPKVAVVNEAFAKRFFEGGNPVGHTFRVEGEAGKPDRIYQIMGLVRNTKYYELREDFIPIGFFPIAQDENPGERYHAGGAHGGPAAGCIPHAEGGDRGGQPGLRAGIAGDDGTDRRIAAARPVDGGAGGRVRSAGGVVGGDRTVRSDRVHGGAAAE